MTLGEILLAWAGVSVPVSILIGCAIRAGRGEHGRDG